MQDLVWHKTWWNKQTSKETYNYSIVKCAKNFLVFAIVLC